MENTLSFEKILLRLKERLCVQTDRDVAELLGLSVKAMTARKMRDSFPVDKLLALKARRPDLRIDDQYILTGKTSARNTTRDAEIMRLHLAGNDAPNNIAAELGISIDEVNAVIERERKARTTAARDAEILASYKSVGDAHVLAKRHGVDVAHVWRLAHRAEVGKQVSRATEYAQAVMRTGEVVCALPANILKTTTGSDAFIQQLEAAIKAQDRDLNVVVAIAVIPVEEIEGMVAAEPIDNPRAVAASLQTKAVNAARKAELPA